MNLRSESRPSKIVLILGVILFAFFQVTTPKGPSLYLSFVDLRWAELSNATPLTPGENLQNAQATFFAKPSQNEGRSGSGLSEVFRVAGPLLRFEQAGRMPQGVLPPILTIKSTAGTELFEFRPPLGDLTSREWSAFEVLVPNEIVGQEVKLSVKVKKNIDPDSWYALRNRMDVFEAPSLMGVLGAAGFWGISENAASKLYEFSDRQLGINLCCLVLAALGILMIGIQTFRHVFSNRGLLLVFLLVSILFHFRGSVFFYWDEWDIIWLFKQNPVSGIIRTHNEHFIPFFFGLYYLENLIFGDKYLLYLFVSFAIHAVNSLNLCLLLSALGRDGVIARRTAQLLAFCFLVSGLHPENLHWAVQQVDLLCEGAVILALFAAARFMHKARLKKLIQVGLAVFAAPLFFGNGLVAAPKVMALAVLAPIRLLNRNDEEQGGFKEYFRRVLKVVLVAGVAGGCSVALYLTHPPSTPPDSSRVFSLSELHRMFDYNITSTQLGTFLRAIGTFPYLNARAPQDLFGGQSILGIEPELGLGWIGLGVSIAVLLGGLMLNGGWRFARLWLLGEAIMVLSMLLPSFGRTKYGLFQGLSLRYTYSTLVGTAIIFFALLCIIQAWFEARDKIPERLFTAFGYSYLLWLLSSSLFISREERFFTDIAYTNLIYRDQLNDWRSALLAEGKQIPERDFSGAGTRLEGYAPTFPANIAPGATPEKAYEVLQFLRTQ